MILGETPQYSDRTPPRGGMRMIARPLPGTWSGYQGQARSLHSCATPKQTATPMSTGMRVATTVHFTLPVSR